VGGPAAHTLAAGPSASGVGTHSTERQLHSLSPPNCHLRQRGDERKQVASSDTPEGPARAATRTGAVMPCMTGERRGGDSAAKRGVASGGKGRESTNWGDCGRHSGSENTPLPPSPWKV
jgi:hypothetical protein